MTITYLNGTTIDGVILSQDADTMRIALRDADDVMVLTRVNQGWVTEDCEPVEVRFEWERLRQQDPVTEDDCICPKELAAHLIQLLLNGEEPNELQQATLAFLNEEPARASRLM